MSFWNSHSNGVLDQLIILAEVSHVVKAIKNNKSAGSDGIVNELNMEVSLCVKCCWHYLI